MTNGTTQATQTGFYRGIKVWHASEIELAQGLFQAVRLTIGRDAARRMAKEDPARIFKKFRYSRPFCPMGENDEVIDAVADCVKWGNKAPRRWIMTPSRKRWGEFLDRMIEVMTRSSHYREDAQFSAAAQALDDAGFAIAESLVVAMLFEAEGDDDIVYTTKVVWRGGRKPFAHDATPAY